MRRCPICQRTYDDNMRFCQADGTPLVDEAPNSGGEDDPFKTVLAEESSASEPAFDPMKTMLAPPPAVDLPPPSPFGEPETKVSPDAPFNSSPFGDLSTPQFNNAPLPSETTPPPQDDYSGGFGQTSSEPFGQSPQPQPSTGFDSAPRTPSFQEPESPFGQQPNFNQQQFGQQPSEWTPPPVPQSGWDNQSLGQNTPFNPPLMGASGQNQTLAIISLVCGILGLCCGILGPVGLIVGYLAYSKANTNPAQYGGKGLALGGMITGGIATLLMVGWILFNILAAVAR